jgi:AraC-like DNA-binding protein
MGELNSAIIMLQVYQAALFALLSFTMFYWYGNYSKKFLGWFMLLNALFSLSKATGAVESGQVLSYVNMLGVSILLSLFPLFYFYLKSLIIPGYRFRNSEMIKLLPAGIILALSVPVYLMSVWLGGSVTSPVPGFRGYLWTDVLKYFYELCVYGYFSIQIVIYSTKVSGLFKLHKSNIEKSFSYTSHITLLWVYSMMTLFLLFVILLGLSRFIGLGRYDLFHNIIGLSELLIILCFAIFATLQQDIYPHHEVIGKEPDAGEEPAVPEPESITAYHETIMEEMIPLAVAAEPGIEPCNTEDCCRVKKYAGSGLTEQQKKRLVKKLDKLMKEKLYRNEKLTIDDVAEKLETNSKYLSQIINESHQKNFYTYINTFRIEEAQRLLNDRQHQKYSIQGIARLAGFSSKSSFNEAFRRITGMTPSEYQEKNSEIAK